MERQDLQRFLVVPVVPIAGRRWQIAEQLTEERDDFEFRYVDINVARAGPRRSAAKAGAGHHCAAIFLDEQHIGGCTAICAYARANLGL